MVSKSQSDDDATTSSATPTPPSSSNPPPSTSTSTKDASSSLSVLQQLQSPDGYYRYLKIPKPSPSSLNSSFLSPPPPQPSDPSPPNDKSTSGIDKDQIERNFRKLSLRHHPDRPGGDAETFRALRRAKYVLLDDKLRKEYDLLGLDLEEDQEGEAHQEDAAGDGKGGGEEGKGGDTVISHMASATIATILQTAVRTAFMGLISTILTRYRFLLYPTICFLLYTAYRITRAYHSTPPQAIRSDILSPLIITASMYIMHSARRTAHLQSLTTEHQNNDHSVDDYWTWKFYLAEVTVMTLFILNSITTDKAIPTRPSPKACFGYAVFSMAACVWIRGKMTRYGIVVALELTLALFAVLVFPIMEMILEEIMREKLKKIGEKVRVYAKVLEEEVASCKSAGGGAGGGGSAKETLKKRSCSSNGID